MRYVWRGDGFYERQTGAPMDKPFAGQIAMPAVISDIPAYASPIDGRMITSRSERREDLKKHGCIDARDFPSPTGGKFRNKRFCEKHNLPLSEDYR